MSSDSRAPRAGMAGFGEKDFDFAVGSVRGLRYWTMPSPPLHQDPAEESERWSVTGLLGNAGFEWASGVMDAVCKHDSSHQPPVEWDEKAQAACGCGIWAYWEMGSASGVLSGYSDGRALSVAGIVEGTGRVIIGELGFRSQHARIVALAPAFGIKVQQGSITRGADAGPGSAPAPEEEEEAARELETARRNAATWMAVIHRRLEEMYPEARIYATIPDMLAREKTGELTGSE